MDYASFLKLSLAARRAFVDAAGDPATGFEPLKDSQYVAERAGAAQADLERDRAKFGSRAAVRVTSDIPEPLHPSVGLLSSSVASTANTALAPVNCGRLGDLAGARAALAYGEVTKRDPSMGPIGDFPAAAQARAAFEQHARGERSDDRASFPGSDLPQRWVEDHLRLRPELVTPLERPGGLGQVNPRETHSVRMRLDRDAAAAETLGSLPDAGSVLAAKIFEGRESARFDSAEAFDQRVAGNGPSQMEQVRPHLGVPDDLAGRDPAWNDVLAGPSPVFGAPATKSGISNTDMALERASRGGVGEETLRAVSERTGSSRSDFAEIFRDLSQTWRQAIPPAAAPSIESNDRTTASIDVSKGLKQATDEAILALQRLTRAAGDATAKLDSSRVQSPPPPLPSGTPFQGRYS